MTTRSMTVEETKRYLVDWAIPRLVHKNRKVRHTAVKILTGVGIFTAEQCRQMNEGDDL